MTIREDPARGVAHELGHDRADQIRAARRLVGLFDEEAAQQRGDLFVALGLRRVDRANVATVRGEHPVPALQKGVVEEDRREPRQDPLGRVQRDAQRLFARTITRRAVVVACPGPRSADLGAARRGARRSRSARSNAGSKRHLSATCMTY